MAFHADFTFTNEGDQVAYLTSFTREDASVPPNQGVSLRFPALDGTIQVAASARDAREPIGTPPGPGGGSVDPVFNNVRSVIELFPPGKTQPVKSLATDSGLSQTEAFGLEHLVPAPAPEGEWEARVTNRGDTPAQVRVVVGAVAQRERLRKEFLAHRLLDNAYRLVLDALRPRIGFEGRKLIVTFGDELRELIAGGSAGDGGLLERREIDLPGRVQRVEGGELTVFVNVGSGNTAINDVPPPADFREEWERRVSRDDAVVHVRASFTDLKVALNNLPDVVIVHATIHLFLVLGRTLQSWKVLAFSPAEIDVSAAGIEFRRELDSVVKSKLVPVLEPLGRRVGRFLGEVLARLAGRDAVFHRLTSNDGHWVVQYTAIPGQRPPVERDTIEAPDKPPINPGLGVFDVVVDGSTTGGPGRGSGPPPDPSLGVLPPASEFAITKPETLARLDKIETLVFVMMENRSFDHLLGYLRRRRGPQYEGLSGGEQNRVVGRTQPVFMRRASEVLPPRPVTQIPFNPNHDFENVAEQIADGAMSGFAQDFEDRHPGFADMVMTFYTEEELKVYDHLAASFNVCDHWFSAHAGPTYPNRFVTLTGLTPELDNFEVDDPDLGFLPQRTIFDFLTERNIRWAVFESDLSIIRMFNRHRLNAVEVRPYVARDPAESFAAVARRGELPPVVFVEPNFVGIPPLSADNDDHPPADLRRGQNFIAEVVNALTASPQWSRTLLAITYDEHGGFYDHVPPPGTRPGPPEFADRLRSARVHPQGRDFMGPRVPAFVVSPFVSPGSVCKDVLDHTSIIKTILLRHRARIPTRLFTQFGPRVNMIAHLGVALDRDTPRTDPPPILERVPGASGVVSTAGTAERPDDFHESLRRAPMPKRG